MENMTKKAATTKEGIPVEDLCRQKSIFCVITLALVAVLLSLHVAFASILGRPSVCVVVFFGVALALTFVELIWLRRQRQLYRRGRSRLRAVSPLLSRL